jgi:alkanesulfonate monooxygenase SsuD/methylene tetrahydromethanopterin reductase-like flavin-dependent oxidoreductase (luciferase family)
MAATTSILTGGHFVPGIGAGNIYNPAWRAATGVADLPAIAMMRDYLVTVRGMLAGESVSHEGKAIRLHGQRLPVQAPRVPVYLGTLGPQMLRLAGEAADGAALNWSTAAQVAWSRERIAEGARRAGRDVSGSRYTSTSASAWTRMRTSPAAASPRDPRLRARAAGGVQAGGLPRPLRAARLRRAAHRAGTRRSKARPTRTWSRRSHVTCSRRWATRPGGGRRGGVRAAGPGLDRRWCAWCAPAPA